ncbi:WAT1-related protein At4g08300-like isoform X1 [Cornus florida]|uniref:WAT1-related protein At4g08300-like isoform X1 n=1 Tax=Cornus florida TaxID=4283 RepID=UPI00289EB399|nr:WAT1-related protein At4g08300-like isoform X1 [Cornus florida]
MGDQKPSGMLSLFFIKIKPYLAIVSLQFGYAGMYILTMVSFKHGISNYVFVVYRHVVASIVIAPFAFLFERKIRPKLTPSVFLKVVALGFLEPVIDQDFYFLGMKKTSASFASAIVNVLPALTFILAIIFRLERVNLKQKHSVAKVIGTSITLTGATVMTLYKGPILDILGNSQGRNHHNTTTSTSADQHWATGTIMVLASTCGWSGFFILQSITLKQYPAPLTLTTLVCLMGILEAGVVALVMEHDIGAWALGWDSRLLAVVYSGVVCSGIAYYVQGMVNKERGPVFVTAFSPLCMIITAVLGVIVLAEQVHLGSLIGAIVIVSGLYIVVWGKSKDYLISKGDQKGMPHELPIVDSSTRSGSVDGINEEHAKKLKTTTENNPPLQEP